MLKEIDFIDFFLRDVTSDKEREKHNIYNQYITRHLMDQGSIVSAKEFYQILDDHFVLKGKYYYRAEDFW